VNEGFEIFNDRGFFFIITMGITCTRQCVSESSKRGHIRVEPCQQSEKQRKDKHDPYWYDDFSSGISSSSSSSDSSMQHFKLTKYPLLESHQTYPLMSPTAMLLKDNLTTLDISSDSSTDAAGCASTNLLEYKRGNKIEDVALDADHSLNWASSSKSSSASSFLESAAESDSYELDFISSSSSGEVYDWLAGETMVEDKYVLNPMYDDDSLQRIESPNKHRRSASRSSLNVSIPHKSQAKLPLKKSTMVCSTRRRAPINKRHQRSIIPNIATTDVEEHVVKDTNRVHRRRASLPLTKPDARSGDWLTNRCTVNQYILLQELGQGSYAHVRLCKEKTSNTLYAMKIMSKSVLRKKASSPSSPLCVLDDVKREIGR